MNDKPEPVQLPREVLDRVNRVYRFHQATKLSFDKIHEQTVELDWPNQPSVYRNFIDLPKVALPTSLLDLPAATLDLMHHGVDVLPGSQAHPEQNLKTIATWLHMADGVVGKKVVDEKNVWLRTCPSSGGTFPYEIYLASFAVDGLEAGFYHYSPRDFSLTKLRDGAETLSRITRGRPDLHFIKDVPALMLVSTIFARSSWRYGARGYRYALLDAGHLLQNLMTVATGLGIHAVGRLRVNDSAMRELIGVGADFAYGDWEAVQGMVIWGDHATNPMVKAKAPTGTMTPITRKPLAEKIKEYPVIPETHLECVAAGVGIVEIRPPLTELTPLPEGAECLDYNVDLGDESAGGSLRNVLMSRRSAETFSDERPMSRDQFCELNRLAFRCGTLFPLKPDGPHVGTIRPFWVVNNISGLDKGIWYYHPPADRWTKLQAGDFHVEGQYLVMQQAHCGEASAVGFFAANLHTLMTQNGPDTYRIAHLEAGMIGQRIYLAATALGLACTGLGSFYDEEIRHFVSMQGTGWEVIHAMAVGMRA